VKRITNADILSALVDFQTYVGQKFDGIDGRLDRMDITLIEHSQALNRIERRLDGHDVRLERLEQQLAR